MGYEVHITRVIPWMYSRRFPILADEVVGLVRRTPDLDMPEASRISLGEFTLTIGADDWLRFHDGELRTKHPREPLIRRMLAIAATLDAWVLGDDDSVYGLTDDRIVERPAVLADLPYPRSFIARGEPISAQQWADLVAIQPDFEWRTRIQARVPSGLRWIDCPAVACWTGHPRGKPVPFFLDEYEAAIDVWQPDTATLTRMRALAPALDADVVDDIP
jgi:hypothetical protein